MWEEKVEVGLLPHYDLNKSAEDVLVQTQQSKNSY